MVVLLEMFLIQSLPASFTEGQSISLLSGMHHEETNHTSLRHEWILFQYGPLRTNGVSMRQNTLLSTPDLQNRSQKPRLPTKSCTIDVRIGIAFH